MAIPSLALLALIGLLVDADVQSLHELRRFSDTIEHVDDQVEARAAIQTERHVGTTTARPTGFSMTQSDLDEALRALGFVGGFEFTDDLDVARQLADNNRQGQALLLYTELISELEADIELTLRSAPLGFTDDRSTALRALLSAEESLLLEDIETRGSVVDPIRLTELHTSATSDLSVFSENASADGVDSLELLTVADFWRELNLIRIGSFGSGTTDDGFDRDAWNAAAEIRSAELTDLVAAEIDALRADTNTAVESEYRRLGLLAATAFIVLALATFITFRLRRSIIGPLSTLTKNARQLARGEQAIADDRAIDEIGEMSRAFASISSTMEHLWTDVDTVASALTEGTYDKRIDTEGLPGDWLRLAETMNSTLATGEEHRVIVREELDRRGAMADISNAAALATTAPELTAAVLSHLPSALAGSHTHLHVHPSGPPTVDLGIPLEPAISALEAPNGCDGGALVKLRKGTGIASLVEFPEGPPAVLVLAFGDTQPTQVEPLISLVETAAKILAQAHRRRAAESRALHDREHDTLTDLPNSEFTRHWFTEQADRSTPWTIIGIQPQRMDELDGRMGRDSRDLVTKSIADALIAVISDVAPSRAEEIVVARLTKPDFAIITPTPVSADLITAFSDRFAEPLIVEGEEVELNATIAYAEVSAHDPDLTQSITNVSSAVAQAEGRETEVIRFEAGHRESLRRKGIIGDWLNHAIENGDLSVHFQPIVNAITTAIEGYEVLLRATMHGQPLSPAEFVPIAEDTGVITAIGDFALREACAALPHLRGNNPYVAVNLSPVQLSGVALLSDIERVLTETKTPRERVIFEVTEGATATPEGLAVLSQIRDLGVKIAIDDFGSGQSNLAYLTNLPAEILKLDRSLVTPMPHDESAVTLVQKTVEMAHALDMTVIGEGVENRAELDALRRVFCDRIQGWYTGKPGPLSDFMEISLEPITSIRIAVEDDR